MTPPSTAARTSHVMKGLLAALVCALTLVGVPAATGAPTTPSGERFYERVTPAFKNGALWGVEIINNSDELTSRSWLPSVARNGEAVLAESRMPLPLSEIRTASLDSRFYLVRTPGVGWITKAIDPAVPEGPVPGKVFDVYGASADLSFVAFKAYVNIDPRDDDGSPPFASGQDVYGYSPGDPSAGHTLLSCPPAPAPPCTDGASVPNAGPASVSAVSADGRTTVFETSEVLAPTADGSWQVYARVGDEIRHISRPLDVVPPGATQVGFDPSFLQGDTGFAPDGGPNLAGAVGGWRRAAPPPPPSPPAGTTAAGR